MVSKPSQVHKQTKSKSHSSGSSKKRKRSILQEVTTGTQNATSVTDNNLLEKLKQIEQQQREHQQFIQQLRNETVIPQPPSYLSSSATSQLSGSISNVDEFEMAFVKLMEYFAQMPPEERQSKIQKVMNNQSICNPQCISEFTSLLSHSQQSHQTSNWEFNSFPADLMLYPEYLVSEIGIE